jgi:hypothetical protein
MDHETALEYVMFLDDLRASGKTNMFGAGPYLREEFGLSRDEGDKVLSAWFKTDISLPMSERLPSFVALYHG